MNDEYLIGDHAKGENLDSRSQPARLFAGKLNESITSAGKALVHLAIRFNNGQWADPFVLLSVILLGLVTASTFLPDYPLSDEGFHWHQITEYFSGRFDTVDSLTMLPGYHLVVYGASELFSFRSISQVRYVSFVFSIMALLFFFLIARQHDKSSSYPISLQLFLSPLIFPFFFLLYTDIPALTMVVASLWLVTLRRYQLAALVVGASSLLFRQTNIVWLLMLWVLSLLNMGFFASSFTNVTDLFRHWIACLFRTSLFAVFCVSFAVFLYINGGVAIGDAGSHKVGLYPTQIFFLLFVLFFLFIPLHIVNFRKIMSALKTTPLLPFAGVILFAIYMFTFSADHNYNSPDRVYFLRNILLELIRANFLTKTLAFIPIVIAFFSIVVTPLKQRGYYWLYPFSIACLLPAWLVDPRYFIVPIALFMLFRKPLDRRFEYLQATIYVPFTVYVFEGVYMDRFFL